MIKALTPPRGALLRPEIDRLVADFGRRDVLWAALRAVIRRAPLRMEASDLSSHLRRDIGLPPVADPRDWRLMR
ncbi:MAG: hypothetical protein LCH69_06475 [Proteobacteria bacterium]|nr:hypothetical protein [Pseudomonadota bacterium]